MSRNKITNLVLKTENDLDKLISFALKDSDSTVTINTINPHSFVEASNSAKVLQAIADSDALVADGVGYSLVSKYIWGIDVSRITGSHLFQRAIEIASQNDKGFRVYFLGSTESTLESMMRKTKASFGDKACVRYFSPPFQKEFSSREVAEMSEDITAFKPDLLFVGLTAPKQEILLAQLKQMASFKLGMSVGAVFDFYSGNKRRAPTWVAHIGCEWLFRLLLEPNRLWRRTIISLPKFLFLAGKNET